MCACRVCGNSDVAVHPAGLRLCEYVDTTGHPTVCYGFNLVANGASSKVAAVGGNYQDVLHGGCLSKTQCAELLSGSVQSATQGAEGIFGNQCSCVMAALIDMTYNLGDAGMCTSAPCAGGTRVPPPPAHVRTPRRHAVAATFTTFISYVKEHNWSAAANDARGTLWCSQVRVCAARLGAPSA